MDTVTESICKGHTGPASNLAFSLWHAPQTKCTCSQYHLTAQFGTSWWIVSRFLIDLWLSFDRFPSEKTSFVFTGKGSPRVFLYLTLCFCCRHVSQAWNFRQDRAARNYRWVSCWSLTRNNRHGLLQKQGVAEHYLICWIDPLCTAFLAPFTRSKPSSANGNPIGLSRSTWKVCPLLWNSTPS